MTLTLIIGIGIGIVIGSFIPSVLRKIKAAVSKEASAVKTAAVADVKKAEANIKSKL